MEHQSIPDRLEFLFSETMQAVSEYRAFATDFIASNRKAVGNSRDLLAEARRVLRNLPPEDGPIEPVCGQGTATAS
jgi:hypothetical protein